jgi:hypothetical protein
LLKIGNVYAVQSRSWPRDLVVDCFRHHEIQGYHVGSPDVNRCINNFSDGMIFVKSLISFEKQLTADSGDKLTCTDGLEPI